MNIANSSRRWFAPAAVALVIVASSQSPLRAQIPIVPSQATGLEVNRGSTYTQDFDTLATSGTSNPWVDDETLPGWVANVSTYRATPNAAAGIYSFGTSTNAERALGAIGQDLPAPGTQFAVRFINRSGAAIKAVTVVYDGEQWRRGLNNPQRNDTLLFAYQIFDGGTGGLASGTWTSVSSLNFNSPNVSSTASANLDGNLPENSLRDITYTITLPGAGLADGQEIWLRWSDLNGAGHEHGNSVDNLRVSFDAAPSLATARQTAADAKEYRLIYNNDGGEVVGGLTNVNSSTPRATAVTNFLGKRVSYVIGDANYPPTEATTVFYCTWGIGMGLFTHHTQKGKLMALTDGGFDDNRTGILHGLTPPVDPLTEVILAGKAAGKEVFWSLRMNDTHDASSDPDDVLLFEYNDFKWDHIYYGDDSELHADEYLLADFQERSGWSGFNYAVPEVRDLVFGFIQEVCQNYDIDGFELDFFRHPVFFRTTRVGSDCTPEEMRVMTQFIARVRAMAEDEGNKRNRPILISVRVPDDADYCRKIGLDVDEWLENDCVDFLVLGGYYQIHNWEDGVAWAREYPGVKVYPSLDDCRLADAEAVTIRETVEAYRGRAAEALNAGMDGVYTYNLWPNRSNPRHQLWNQMGDPDVLEPLNKDYVASFHGKRKAAGGSLPHDSYQTRERLNPENPYTVTTSVSKSAKLMLADTSTVGDPDPAITLRLRIRPPFTVGNIGVTMNGTALSVASPSTSGNWIIYTVPPGLAIRGENTVTVSSTSGSVVWEDLLCQVRYP